LLGCDLAARQCFAEQGNVSGIGFADTATDFQQSIQALLLALCFALRLQCGFVYFRP
jgi:hypothetical protein